MKIHLLQSIDIEDNEGNIINNPSINTRIEYAKTRFSTEKPINFQAPNGIKEIESRLRDMALNVAYTDNDILTMLSEWGVITNELTNLEYFEVIENYWSSLAYFLYQLFVNKNVPTSF